MHQYGVESGSVSLVAATAKTVWQWVTGSTRRSRLLEVGFSFVSTTATHIPVLAELRIQSTAGTSSAFTPTLSDQTDPAAISTARNVFTVEPTDVSLLQPGPWSVTPVGGLFVYNWSQSLADYNIIMAVSTRLGLRLTAPDAQTGVRAYGLFQE